MKKLTLMVVAIVVFAACKTENPEYAKVSGKINTTANELLLNGRSYSKIIKVDEDGNFSDTLKIKKDMYAISTEDGVKTTIFLENGYNLKISQNGEKPTESFDFEGNGKESNIYFANLINFFTGEKGDPKEYFKLDEAAFKTKIASAKDEINAFNKKNVDSLVLEIAEKNNKQFFGFVESSYEREHSNLVKFAAGNDSPVFENYENFKGGKTSLTDLKGKYVYIDIWATWCGPCKREIPSLKALEEDFHGKNIEFVSISVDNVDGKRGSYDSWKKMVAAEQLSGIQLFADKDFNSDFIREYNVNSIPRFILIDPQGKIVDSNAKRPSNPALKEELKALGI
ncbi:TlpA disulfide reductase family protein [Lutibacter sp. TH_r2]|uniref:TlpA family protein disulfide reductase n=1 Tax=Lutibacter sp. TH_r2 TaxID=3082083 RepID=UPI002954698F|nr:TlpA disulfide reductase family protein [Lutibacter sp. TH_r2]MDV7187241.1 TlpA disulfide reductase family protein [Lutibacter sp. TH_r2]